MVDDLWMTRCAICGTALDRLKNEDFYDADRGIVTCAAHRRVPNKEA